MKEKKTEWVKEKLKEYGEVKKEYDLQLMRYMEKKEKLYEPKTPSSGDGGTGTREGEHLSDALSELQEMEEEILKLKEVKREKRMTVQELIEKLPKAEERSIMRLRYFDGKSWDDIAKTMYNECDETFIRKLHRAHGRAIGYLTDLHQQQAV